MKTALKVLALGVAIAASATMAKADSINGTLSIGVPGTFGPTSMTFTGTPTQVIGTGDFSIYTCGNGAGCNTSFAGYGTTIPYAIPSGTELFELTDTTNGEYLTFTATATGQTNVSLPCSGPGGNCNYTFYDQGTLNLYTSNGGTLIGSSSGYVTANPGGGLTLAAAAVAAPTPEPSSLALLGTGLLGMAGMARRRFMSR